MNENAKGSVKGTDKDPRRPSAAGGREVRFTTVSGESIAPLYAPDDVAREQAQQFVLRCGAVTGCTLC